MLSAFVLFYLWKISHSWKYFPTSFVERRQSQHEIIIKITQNWGFSCVFFSRVVNDATFLTLFLHFSLILIKLNLTPMPSFLFYCVKKKKDLKFISTISSHFGRRCECDIKRVRVKKKKWSLKEVNGICFCFSFLGDFYKSSRITIKRNFYCSHIEPFNLSHEEYRDCDLSIPTRHRKMY